MGWGATLNTAGRAALSRIRLRDPRTIRHYMGLAGLPVRPLESRPTGSTPVSLQSDNTSQSWGLKVPGNDMPKHDPSLPPREPPDDVAERQDREHTEDDFLQDLRKASRRIKQPPTPPSGPDRGSSRTSRGSRGDDSSAKPTR